MVNCELDKMKKIAKKWFEIILFIDVVFFINRTNYIREI